ncbi:MAG: LuxR C-terminal-related transcriptional regulator [Cyclobacteriaceae bacterium]
MSTILRNLLFISPKKSKINEEFVDLLKSNGFSVDQVTNVNEALEKLQRFKFQLTISTESIDMEKGDHIYRLLEPELLSQAIPFFLILEDFQKEDIMFALELGIDNVIFLPLEEASTIRKINKEINKKSFLNFLNTSDFKSYFNNSHIPMMLVEKDSIHEMNDSFSLLWNSKRLKGKRIEEVFEFPNSTPNSLNHKRFHNNIINYCKIKDVSFKDFKGIHFDLLMFKGGQNKHNRYLIEIFPNAGSGMEITYSKSQIKMQNDGSILTAREAQVLELSSYGLPIKLIATRLGVSNRTIEKHRSNIMEKLGVKNMIEALSTLNGSRIHQTAL